MSVKFLIDQWKAMNGRDNDALLVVDGILQFRRVIAIRNRLYLSLFMVEAKNGVLQLIVQYATVCHHKYRLEHLLVFIIMQRRQSIGQPSNRVRLAATSTMLQQIALTFLRGFGVCHQLFYHIQLVIAREDYLG